MTPKKPASDPSPSQPVALDDSQASGGLEKSEKPAVILLHGLRGDHHGLLELANKLRDRGYRLFVPDLPGYGNAPALSEQNLNAYINWLQSYVDNLKLSVKPVIVGHSMGSILLSHYHQKFPDGSNRKTVFLSPIMRSRRAQKSSNYQAKLMSGSLKVLPNSARLKFVKSKVVSRTISHYLTTDKTMQKYIDKQHYMYSGRFESADGLISDAEISMREQTVLPKCKEILIYMGDKDRLTKLNIVKDRLRGRQNVTLQILPGAGHLINYERPEEIAEAIDNFISR